MFYRRVDYFFNTSYALRDAGRPDWALFFQSAALPKIILLAVVMLGLAYLFEYTKKRDSGGKYGK